ncbi:MAG: hypothetical protein Q9209_007798, partial [Squamulea sp. 1 TL-2023]
KEPKRFFAHEMRRTPRDHEQEELYRSFHQARYTPQDRLLQAALVFFALDEVDMEKVRDLMNEPFKRRRAPKVKWGNYEAQEVERVFGMDDTTEQRLWFYPQPSEIQQYPSPPAPAPLSTQFPPPPPPLSAYQPDVAKPVAYTVANTPEIPIQRTSAIPSPSQSQSYGLPPKKNLMQKEICPPPPNAPPTPAYTPTSHYGSAYPTPSQYIPQTHHQQRSANGQPLYIQLANAPPVPALSPYSSTSTGENRPQPVYQAPANLPPTPQYTPDAYGYGTLVPQALGRTRTSYFPQQSQPPQTQPTSTQPAPPTPNYDQGPVVISPPATESEQPDLSKLSLNEPQQPPSQTPQDPNPAAPQVSLPTHSLNQCPDVIKEAKFQLAYAQPSPSITYTLGPQYATHPAAVRFTPPPPYSPSPQAYHDLHPIVNQEIQPQQSHMLYQQQQLQTQAQVYIQQQTRYYPGVQQQPQYAQAQIQQYQQGLPVEQVQSMPRVQSVYGQEAPPSNLANQPGKDDEKTGKVTRFLGDTLVGRFTRSSLSTVTTTMKMPAVLSPWGDNNPVTLPNVRYRDAALYGTFAVIGVPLVDGVSDAVAGSFGTDNFVSEVVSSGADFITGNTIVKHGVFQIVEQAIDKGVLEHVLPEVEKTMRTTTAKTLQVSIKHKLMGVEADIRMYGPYPTANFMACDKGWFAPYLYASSRTPVIKRSEDFAMAQFFKPYLVADTNLTHKLLTESASVIPLCESTPSARLPYARLLVTFIGISPFRGESSGMWSTSRRPSCGQLHIHMFNGCPTLVIPAHSDAQRTPVIAWSPWTLKQMHEGNGRVGLGAQGEYTPQKQHEQICAWLLEMVERAGVHPSVANIVGSLERVVRKVVTMIINGAMSAPRGGKVCGVVDSERAGIVAMRY